MPTDSAALDLTAEAKVDLLFLCAGKGTRVGLDDPKQFVSLHGIPLMAYSLLSYERMPFVGAKIIVYDLSESERVARIVADYGITNCRFVAGGATRQDSVRAGLAEVRTSRVLSHNAAVPFVTIDMVTQVLRSPADCATTVVEVQDNLVRHEKGRLVPVERRGLQVINSPQSLHSARFRDAHHRAHQQGLKFTSDTELMLHFGHSLELVPGPAWSFKITDRVDLALAETILSRPDLFPALLHHEVSERKPLPVAPEDVRPFVPEIRQPAHTP